MNVRVVLVRGVVAVVPSLAAAGLQKPMLYLTAAFREN